MGGYLRCSYGCFNREILHCIVDQPGQTAEAFSNLLAKSSVKASPLML